MFTDDASAYEGMPFAHESVNHSAGEYVRGMAHTNGIESFWSMLKRGYQGTFHHFSVQHLAGTSPSSLVGTMTAKPIPSTKWPV